MDFSEIYDKLQEQPQNLNDAETIYFISEGFWGFGVNENVQGLQSQAQKQQFVINNLQVNF